MEIVTRTAAILLMTLTATSCALAPEDPAPDKTLKEIMAQMVGPSSNTLWGSVSLVETDDGLEEKGPQTDAQWLALRQSAESIVAAAALMTRQELSVAPPGTPSQTPGVELAPDAIEALIKDNREAWDQFAQALGATGRVFLNTVKLRDSKPLMDAGDELNTACENCHQVFWYPST